MPMSLLEAVGFDARVIVSDIPENTACLDGYGNSFEKGNVDSLKEILDFCLKNPKLKSSDFKKESNEEQTKAKREELMLKYDWNAITDRTIEIYQSLSKK